jgi:glyoxylase-like metal-dependent hydrolase (beta-lactamase superfamily II)
MQKTNDMSPHEITKEIFQVGGGRLTSSEDAAIYLINIDSHVALVDAGCGHFTAQLLENIRACNVELNRIEYLLITHCHFDHTGGIKGMKDELPQAVIVAHKLDATYLEQGDNTVTAARWYDASIEPFIVDRKLAGPEEEILLGDRVIKAIHVPGHSPGSVVYLMESVGKKVLFGQDVYGPIDALLKSDRIAYRKSLELLLTLNADILCEGHYGIIEGKEEVMEFIRSFL